MTNLLPKEQRLEFFFSVSEAKSEACPEQAAVHIGYATQKGSTSWLKPGQEGANPYCPEIYWLIYVENACSLARARAYST